MMIAAPTMANEKYRNSSAYSCVVVSTGDAVEVAAYIVGPVDQGLEGGGGRARGGGEGDGLYHGNSLGGKGAEPRPSAQDGERASREAWYLYSAGIQGKGGARILEEKEKSGEGGRNMR